MPAPAAELDLRGEVCPYTLLRTRLALDALPPGAVLRVVLGDETAARDVPRTLANGGHAILGCRPESPGVWVLTARKAGS